MILDEIRTAAKKYPEWAKLLPIFDDPSIGVHLAVMVQPYLSYILVGRKTIESRFSKNTIAPFRRITVGDLVLLKAGPVVGSFRVSSTEFIVFNDRELARLRRDHSESICADGDEFWHARSDKRYATLIGIEDVRKLPAVTVSKRDMRGWIVLRAPSNPFRTHRGLPKIAQAPVAYTQIPLPLAAEEICREGHVFRPSVEQPPSKCLHCAADIVDWPRVHRRQAADWEYIFTCLRSEHLRRGFWEGDIDLQAKRRYEVNANRVHELAVRRLKQSVSKVYGSGPEARPYRDGYQTPRSGDILFYAQHALACCCRRCMRYWHNIPYGRALHEEELEYLAFLMGQFIEVRMNAATNG